MHTLLKARGVSLVVLVFPISDQVNESYRTIDEMYVRYPQSRIREICAEHGIPILDLTETLYKNGGTRLFKDYLHLNGEGNDVIANALENYLSDSKFLILNGNGRRDRQKIAAMVQ